MKRFLYAILFVLVAAFTMSYREYLTLEEVNANNKTTETKVTKLEKEFKNLNNTFEEQQKKMKQATAQASDAQAKLHSNIRM